MKELIPTKQEILEYLLTTVKHSIHFEYFIQHLKLQNDNDTDYPHDIVGPGNKFEWIVVKGFALGSRRPKVDFEIYIKPALDLHRQQYHHQLFF